MIQPRTAAAPDILDDIRAGFAFVKDRAAEVRVREDLLATCAQKLPARHPATVFDQQHHFIGDDEQTAAYVLTLDAVNFGSGFVPALEAESWAAEDGFYFTIAARLKRAFMSRPLTAHDLAAADETAVAEIFRLPGGPAGRQMAALFAQGWQDLGRMIAARHQGSFMQCVRAAQGKAARLVDTLVALPQFRDIHDFEGRAVPLLKRAQSTAADLHDAFRHKGVTLFHDIDRLTVLADNDVPHILRMEGVLEYAPALAEAVDAGEEILSGSRREIEIRACAGYAAEKLAALKGIAPIALDRILWHRAQEDPRCREKPAHRSASTFY